MDADTGIRETTREPQPYSIAADKFKLGGTNVDEPQKYVFPEQVTREKFGSFLTGLFAKSRGHPPMLWLQCEWLQVHEKFNYNETLTNFYNGGLTRSFSPAEMASFQKAFDSVKSPTHTEITESESLPFDLRQNVLNLIESARDTDLRKYYLTLFSAETIASLKTREQLFAAVDEYVRAHPLT